jgi:NADH-quinone oxidoreductase subunit F
MNMKISTIDQLKEIKQEFLNNQESYKYQVLVCGGSGCISSSCTDVENAIINEIREQGIEKEVKVHKTGCMGTCAVGPVVLVLPDKTLYTELNPEKAKEIVQKHLVNNTPVVEYTYYDKTLLKSVPKMDDIEFFKSQVKIVLDLCGIIDYSNIDDYIAHDGYLAAAKAITGMTPEDVVKEVEISGLRGRGGAGFSTGAKLRACFSQESDIKYMVCNANEGDPGAFMDISVIEGDPHCIIEGMILSAYAISAQQGYICVRAESYIAIERLKVALDQAYEFGLLGKNIFDTGYNFDIEIRIGAGAFVCGEETALIASIEGKRGEPKQKPPFPFQKGLFGKPTIVNNVETLANLPKIIRNGGNWYASIGLKGATGTKVFSLAGDLVNPGLVEVPIGTPIGNIIYNIGGGIPNKKAFKAAQIGGPSGGCITKENLNVPADYESLSKIGAIMGSGGIIVMNEDTCMVDTARFFMDFIHDESCGKCTACRVGNKRMLEILEFITEGKGLPGDIEVLIELGETIQKTAMCGLGQTAPNPILSTIRFFREEFEEHINKKYCRAGVCTSLFTSPCENTCPAHVNVSGYISLITAGKYQDAYNLIMRENPFPAICGRIWSRPCERKCRRATVDEAIGIRNLKRFAADFAFKNELPYKLQITYAKKGKNVAVVGAGASGLTCAYYLANIGYDVDVYESQSVAGGMLAYGIPEFRLPKAIIQHEIDLIKQAGVNIHFNTEIGRDIEFKYLCEDYDAVYVAAGTQYPSKVNIDGEDMQGVIHVFNFLKDINLKNAMKLHGTVAVIGSGNVAIDSARSALRLGAERVIIIYKRNIDAMSAYHEEIVEAIEEGVEIMEMTAMVKLIGNNDNVTGIECVKMELGEFDASGRRKPVEIKGSNFVLDVDYVIPVMKQHADSQFINNDKIGVTQWGTFIIDPDTQMSTMEGVFAGGDVVRGPEDAICAIADGKKAASSIDIYLGGTGELNKGAPINIPSVFDDDEVVAHPQFEQEKLSPEVRKQSFAEVVSGFHKINAIAESMRCLHCERR